MEGKRRFYYEDTRKLMKCLAPFEEDEENFEICQEFALSRFTNDVFPDTNWWEVNKRIKGLSEKFYIDGEEEKSHKIANLFNELLHKLEDNFTEKANTYDVLSLLGKLCGSVTDAETSVIFNMKQKIKTDDHNDGINWAKYLSEDNIVIPNLSDDDDSEWSDMEISCSDRSLHISCSPAPGSSDSGIGQTPDGGIIPFTPLGPFQTYKKPMLPLKQQQYLHQYWYPHLPTKLLTCKSFTHIWERFLAEHDALYTPGANTCLRETDVLRDILWMLHGVKETFLFSWVNGEFQVRKFIHLAHYTEGTLLNLLSPLCQYGNKMISLQSFVSDSSSLKSRLGKVHTAYGKIIHHYLFVYSSFLIKYEKIIAKQKTTMTIIQLTSQLKPHLDFLDFLYGIHSNTMDKIPSNSTPFEHAIILLDSLWKRLCNNSLWMTRRLHVQALLKIFLATFHPFLNMLESSIVHGQIIDENSEFPITELKAMEVTNNEFWIYGFNVRDMSTAAMKDFFLKPLFEDIVLASTSMKIIRILHLHFSLQSQSQYEKGNLLKDFIQRFKNVYAGVQSSPGILNEDDVKEDEPDLLHYSESSLNTDLPNLTNQIETWKKVKHSCIDLDEYQKLYDSVVELVQPASLVLLNDLMEQTLFSSIKATCQRSKLKLVEILKEDYKLMLHLSVMRQYLLMESGHVMFAFYSQVFQKMFSEERWQNSTYLNLAFQDATCYSEESHRLSFYFKDENRSVVSLPLRELELVNMYYNVGWPINVVLNENVQNSYCKLFQFLLQIKCAKYCLDELFFCPLKAVPKPRKKVMKFWLKNAEMPQTQIIHGLNMLKMKLLHFVNGFHGYIMTLISHSFSLHLTKKLEEAESLGDMIFYHENYVHSLLDHCFLTSKHRFFYQHIQLVLNLALKLRSVWNSGIEHISTDDLCLTLKGIEDDYCGYLTIINSYLNKPKKKAVNLHWDALSIAIHCNHHFQKVFSCY